MDCIDIKYPAKMLPTVPHLDSSSLSMALILLDTTGIGQNRYCRCCFFNTHYGWPAIGHRFISSRLVVCCRDHRDRYLGYQQKKMLKFWYETSIGCESRKCTQAVQDGLLGGHKCSPVKHKHMLLPPACSFPLIIEDLPGSRPDRYMRMDSS